jgi:hypothetical protein
MARTSSVNQAKRSRRGEGDRCRYMKNPQGGHAQDAAAPLGREALPGQLSDDRVLGFWAHPLLKQLRGLFTKASSVSNSLI